MDSNSSVSSERNEEDIFQILIATDIHLGYAENDPVRGPDTFETFEEILRLAVSNNVDFVLLGGDLFHDARPSPYCIYKCVEILRKYCMGERPITIEFLSDPSHNFSQSMNPTVNYEDPNLNVALPVFSIHGNHDDPTGQKHISALDLLSSSGLINYFGRWNQLDHVEISPILLRKGNSNLALYGLSHLRDERLGRLFVEKKVKMLSPGRNEDWFQLLVLHQNRIARSTKNYIPQDALPELLDLVIWGHEHDCRIEIEKTAEGVSITQPGSSVATSLIAGESITKKVGLLQIHQKEFQLIPIKLKTVRPFVHGEITLDDLEPGEEKEETDRHSLAAKALVTARIESMIQKAKEMGHNDKVSQKPLIRLHVKYKHELQVFNTIRFGQAYTDKVANPENMVKLNCAKVVRQKKNQNNDAILEDEEISLPDSVEDLVAKHFRENEPLSMFTLNAMNEAVKKYVAMNDSSAINDVTNDYINEALKQLEKDLPDIDQTEANLFQFRESMEANSVNFVNDVLNNPKRMTNNALDDGDGDDSSEINDESSVIIDSDDDQDNPVTFKKPTVRGKKAGSNRGAGTTRAAAKPRAPRRGGRGRAASK